VGVLAVRDADQVLTGFADSQFGVGEALPCGAL